MATRQLDAKVFHLFRNLPTYFAKERQIYYSTTPFLTGVGCGGGVNTNSTIEQAREAVAHGYKLRVQVVTDHKGKRYPLHPEDLALLQSSFRTEDFL